MDRQTSIVIVGTLVIAGVTGSLAYYTHQQLAAYGRQMDALSRQVADSTRMAKEDSAAAAAASQLAIEATRRAEMAANARTQAEQQRSQAQAAQTQAESAALKATERANSATAQLESLKKQRQQELDQMQEALNRVVETKRTPTGMLLILPDSMFKFDFDSAELKPHNRELLSRVAGILLASKGFGLSVFGYTDDVGTAEYNQKLSEKRASAVRDYLVEAGIDPSIINAKGFGKTSPRVRGETQEARAINRRVEIAVTDSEVRYDQAQ